MNLKNLISATLLALTFSSAVYAQHPERLEDLYKFNNDAYTFSGAENSATARFNSLGGQQTSLGGDMSSLYGNPAGLGMFSKSEFSLTTGINNIQSNSNFLGSSYSNSTFNPTINNLGMVFHSPASRFNKKDLKKGLVAFNYGIGYQKNNFFRSSSKFSGETNANGLSDYFAEAANYEGVIPKNLSSDVLYYSYLGYLINNGDGITDNDGDGAPDLLENQYVPNTDLKSKQTIDIVRKGGQSNFNFSLGLNFSNNLYVGAGVGIASINYKSNETLNETGEFWNPVTNYNANFTRNYETKGSGINFKLGAILKPVKEIRVGLSFESPTYYDITDNHYEGIDFQDPNGVKINGNDDSQFSYSLRTPLKINGGISYIVGKKGFISTDISFIDYNSIKFKSSDIETNRIVNNRIQSVYQEVINVGIGAEYKIDDAVAVRAGYRYMSDPYKNSVVSNAMNRISAGVGYRFANYYLDGAFMVYKTKDNYSSYRLINGNHPQADISKSISRISLTFGAKF